MGQFHSTSGIAGFPGPQPPNPPIPGSNASALNFQKNRYLMSPSPDKWREAFPNGPPSRPSSTSSSGHGSTREFRAASLETQNKDNEIRTSRQSVVIPKSNVIEPRLLLSYLTLPAATRPSILLLDLRPRESYETGCLNADSVVWIDPILLDEEYFPCAEST